MYISDKEVRTQLEGLFRRNLFLSKVDICIPILRGGKEILDRIPDKYKKNWKIFPITVKSYSDITNKQSDHVVVDIPQETINFISQRKNENILVLDDVYHTGNTISIVKKFLGLEDDPTHIYYLTYADKSGNDQNFLHLYPTAYALQIVRETDWIEFEWEIERNKVNK